MLNFYLLCSHDLNHLELKDDIDQLSNQGFSLIRNYSKVVPVIKRDAWSAYLYARYRLKKRWKEAEQYIMKDPGTASCYARYIMYERWPEAEPYLMKDPFAIYSYSKNVLKRRWLEAEPAITGKVYWYEYCQEFGLC